MDSFDEALQFIKENGGETANKPNKSDNAETDKYTDIDFDDLGKQLKVCQNPDLQIV